MIYREFPDNCSAGGAERLMREIRQYWAKDGHVVRVWVVAPPSRTTNEHHGQMIYSVRSNLLNGLPRKEEV
jgi:hypothetical protein